MKTLLTGILLILSIRFVEGQNYSKTIKVTDKQNVPIVGAFLNLYNTSGKLLTTTRSDFNGEALITCDSLHVNIWAPNFKELELNTENLNNETSVVILEETRYPLPDLIIKNNTFLVDYSMHKSTIEREIIDYHGDCNICNNKLITQKDSNYESEKCDTLIYSYYLYLSKPYEGNFNEFYKKLYQIIQESKSIEKKDLCLDFAINKYGEMIFEDSNNDNKEFELKKELKEMWIPAKTSNSSIDSRYRLMIKY